MSNIFRTSLTLASMYVLGPAIAMASDSASETTWRTSSTSDLSNLVAPGLAEQFKKDKWQQWLSPGCSIPVDPVRFPVLGMFEITHPSHPIDLNVRLKETTDFLRSYPVIGMRREQLLELLGPPSINPKEQGEGTIDFFQLNQNACLMNPLLYLEFKYSNGLVSAFRMERIKYPNPSPEVAGQWMMPSETLTKR